MKKDDNVKMPFPPNRQPSRPKLSQLFVRLVLGVLTGIGGLLLMFVEEQIVFLFYAGLTAAAFSFFLNLILPTYGLDPIPFLHIWGAIFIVRNVRDIVLPPPPNRD